MERILVGVDGSPASLDALVWAGTVGRRAKLDVVAVRVWQADRQVAVTPDAHRKLRAEAHDELDDWCGTRPLVPAPSTVLVSSDPPDALLTAALDHRADLLVVGTRGAGGFAHLHLGSVAHHLAHHTTVPLAIVPRSAATTDVRHVVVGTDGSPGATAAVSFCATFAASIGVPVTAVLAEEPFFEWRPDADPRSWRHRARTKVWGWAAPVENAGVRVDVVVERDIHPVAALSRALDGQPGAIAVVGARGLGGFSGLRLGRVPLQLVDHTGAAVIVVPVESDRRG